MAKAATSTRSKAEKKSKTVPAQEVNIVDLLLIDHKYLKECISVLKDEDANNRTKASYAKGLLDAVAKHSEAEKKTLYKALEQEEDFRASILEGYIEHGIVDAKVKMLTPKVARVHTLNENLAAEMKVLAEILEHHIREEESDMLPQVKSKIDDEVLMELGSAFMKKRKFTEKDLSDFPPLQAALIGWKDTVQEMSSKFMTKMDKYVESLKH